MSVDALADIHVEDIEYLRHPSGPLLARIYRPKEGRPRAALVSLHGGRWTRETRLTNAVIDEALARDGALVMALDIRMPPVARYPDCVADINYAIRWLKVYARMLGVAATASAASARRAAATRSCSAPCARAIRATPLFPVPTASTRRSPSSSPAGRCSIRSRATRWRRRKGMDEHVAAHHAYWPDEAAQAEGNPQMILDRGERVELPPALVIQGTGDVILPTDMADNFAAAYRKAGGSVDLRKFDGQPHTFITKEPTAAGLARGHRGDQGLRARAHEAIGAGSLFD